MEKLFDISLSVIIFLVDLKDMSVVSGSFTSILKGKAESRPRICFLESAIMGLKCRKKKGGGNEETNNQYSKNKKIVRQI